MLPPFRMTHGCCLLGILSRPSALVVILAALALLPARPAAADTLKITSTPPGATVEIDGVAVGKTPYQMKVPGSYLHRPATALNSRLGHAMRLRVTLQGYASKEIVLTEGPMEWVALNGRKVGDYWLLKSDHFDIALEPASAKPLTGTVTAVSTGNSRAELRPELPVEEIVQRAKPAVLLLTRPDGDGTGYIQGTGFLITDTGVIATNAHVVGDEQTVAAELPTGQKAEGKVVYKDPKLDIALVKVDGSSLPHLPLADLTTVRQGQTVVAVGNPGGGLPFTATKGIVSAVGALPGEPGKWVQTDAAINHGNSGGPLLNGHGEAIGINTLVVTKNDNGDTVQDIGYALSSSDLLDVLHRFYPAASAASSAAPAEAQPSGEGSVAISSDPDGAEVYLDGKFVGNAPETLKLPAGSHTIEMKAPGRAEWQRSIEILKDSQLNLKAQLIAK